MPSLVARVRHDLRNPLGHVIGFSEVLMEDAESMGQSRLKEHLKNIHQIANELIGDINIEVDMNRLESDPAALSRLLAKLQGQSRAILTLAATIVAGPPALEGPLREDAQRIIVAADNLVACAQAAFPKLEERLVSGLRGNSPARRHLRYLAGFDSDPLSVSRREGRILVVDDQAENRALLNRRLKRLGYTVAEAIDGLSALEYLAKNETDLVLLDFMMPGIDGLETLKRMKSHRATDSIPVIMLSSADDIDMVVRCIELGAEDFLPKPFNPVLLLARIDSSLTKKRLRDNEREFLGRLQVEQERSERLLLNILPQPIAARLKIGEHLIADHFADVTVMFADFVGFTRMCAGLTAREVVQTLNDIFSCFDRLCQLHGLEKIKTIGDAYLAVGGLPTQREGHAESVAKMALSMQREIKNFHFPNGDPVWLRIGINSGPVVAGVIGTRKFAYDLWGDTVNLASRMESQAPKGGILVTETTHALLGDKFLFLAPKVRAVKGRGQVRSYILKNLR